MGFAIFLSVVILVGRALGESLGGTGAIIGAGVIGVADVDAATVSLAKLAPQPISGRDATFAILTAVATNTLSKIMIGGVIGRGRFAIEIIILTLGCFAAAAVALWVTVAVLAL